MPSFEDVETALDILSKVDSGFFVDNESARQKALAASRALSRRLELPGEVLMREIWTQPIESVAIKVSQDIRLFDIISSDGDTYSLETLADLTSTSPHLLSRFLRLLYSVGIIERTADHEYRGTKRSEALSTSGACGGMTHLLSQVWPCFSSLPSFLCKTDYQNPVDVEQGPWQHGLHTSDKFFEWLRKRHSESECFHEFMAEMHRPSEYDWTKTFPVSTLADDPPIPGIPLVVDVGGGLGFDMIKLRNALHPHEIQLEVQDLEDVIEQGRQNCQDADVHVRIHNFFDPQPVIGARAYFLHSVLHDWPDHLAVKILQNLHHAMKIGYSTLLLCELVNLPDGRSQVINTMDIVMMGLLCSKERTEAEWKELLQDGGFMLHKIWRHPSRMLNVIEALPFQRPRL